MMRSCLRLCVVVLLAAAFFELVLRKLVRVLRHDFQWLITAEDDEIPQIDTERLARFFERSFDPELGWAPRPGPAVPAASAQPAG